MDRYFDKPDAKFDLDIFEESIDLLIKYNDRDGVTTFWRLMEEMNVEPPEELREKVSLFFFNKKHTELQSNTPFWGGPEASSLVEI